MIDKNFSGLDTFFWFFGIVEDRQDPLGLGRVRVRIFGHHTASLTDIPSTDLPWAQTIQSSNDGMFSTPKEDDMVFGFFADGRNAQYPIVVGKVPGYFSQPPNTGQGFNDLRTQDTLKLSPKKPVGRTYNTDGSGIIIAEANIANSAVLESMRHPNVDELGHETITGLSRYQNLANTTLQARKQNLDKGVVTSLGLQWDEPYPAYNALYPYNQVNETESGHSFELDDTPRHERVAITHRSGSFVEWFPSGTKVEKVTKSNYQVVMADDHLHVMGKVLVTIDSDAHIRVVGNVNLEVDNNLNANVAGDTNFTVGGNFNVKAKSMNMDIAQDASIISDTQHFSASGEQDIHGGQINVQSDGNMNILAGGSGNFTSAGKMNLDGSGVLIGSGDVELTGTVKINSLGPYSSATGYYQQVNVPTNSPSAASGAAAGTKTGLGSAPSIGTPNKALVPDESVPVPLKSGIVEFDAYTGTAYKQNLYLDQNSDGSYSDPGANAANVAIAAGNLVCDFDPSKHTFISDSSTWAMGSNGLALIKAKEGFAKVISPDTVAAYPDPATGGEPITIGYGSTSPAIDQPVSLGETISRSQADAYLMYAINKKFIPVLRQTITVPLTQNMIDACISLMYNIGGGRFKTSALARAINAQQWCAAGDQFLVWNKAAGQVLPGLTLRRQQERNLFIS